MCVIKVLSVSHQFYTNYMLNKGVGFHVWKQHLLTLSSGEFSAKQNKTQNVIVDEPYPVM
jgi:hypothetical protein